MASGDEQEAERWLPLLDSFEGGCFWFWVNDIAVHAAVRPTILLDIAGRLHCDDRRAFGWLSDIQGYYWHGVHVPRHDIERPDCITVKQIKAEANTEVRRVMIERYRCGDDIDGVAAYIRDAGERLVDVDERYGTLWLCEFAQDEPIAMIEVVNATPDADGHFKRYWLRVPPATRTAREAVARTFVPWTRSDMHRGSKHNDAALAAHSGRRLRFRDPGDEIRFDYVRLAPGWRTPRLLLLRSR
jgi:hypothetical protein